MSQTLRLSDRTQRRNPVQKAINWQVPRTGKHANILLTDDERAVFSPGVKPTQEGDQWYMSVPNIAKTIGVNHTTVYRWIQNGHVNAQTLPSQHTTRDIQYIVLDQRFRKLLKQFGHIDKAGPILELIDGDAKETPPESKPALSQTSDSDVIAEVVQILQKAAEYDKEAVTALSSYHEARVTAEKLRRKAETLIENT